MQNRLDIDQRDNTLKLSFFGELTLYSLSGYQKQIANTPPKNINRVVIELYETTQFDTASALFLDEIMSSYKKRGASIEICSHQKKFQETLDLVATQKKRSQNIQAPQKNNFFETLGIVTVEKYFGFVSFMAFLGELFFTKLSYLVSVKNIRYKEIAFEIYESSIKAIAIIALTSFLVGLVVAYQSAYQLKIYGANIFIVDMLGIAMLRELAPLMSAIVIAGRSGSAFSAQIGAMKITQELDAMRTMGFNPYAFLVMPKILALMLMMPILISIADIMGVLGGMIVANIDLDISASLFIDRFKDVVGVEHFFVGIVKGPFFAFLIASIGIYRGLMVKDDTQSIGLNTTKSVVESIFAVIVCDALFSIFFTNLGI